MITDAMITKICPYEKKSGIMVVKQYIRQPLRGHDRKSLLSNMDFCMSVS